MSLRTFFVGLAALVLANCASGGDSSIPAGDLPPPDPIALQQLGADADYRIGPMDQLEIAVFQVPDMSRTVQVDGAGRITLPLVGVIPAAGSTTAELQSVIATKLGEKYLNSPEVLVTVKQFASQKVTVDGAVGQPGVYGISGRTSLVQALAMARGPTRMADIRNIVVFRHVNGQRMAAKFDLAAIRKGQEEDPQVYGNDVIVVDSSASRGILREVLGVLPLYRVFSPVLF